MSYDKGDLVRCIGTFKDLDGAALDPTSVTFKLENPSGAVTTYVYGIDAQLVKTATGIYRVDVDASSPGRYWYKFYSTGTGQAAEEKDFAVGNGRF